MPLNVNILIKRVDVKVIYNHCKVQSFIICFRQLASQADPMSNTLPLLLGRLLHHNRVSYGLLYHNTRLMYNDLTDTQRCNFCYYLGTLQPKLTST
jgi:hypothetical protein